MDSHERPPLSGTSVDVILLAVVIALHVTKRNDNLKLILVVLLVVHVAATTQRFRLVTGSNTTPSSAPPAIPTASTESGQSTTPVDLGKPQAKLVASAGYDRQFTSPDQLTKTRDVLPSTSDSANGKLVDSRTRFFEDIIN